MTLEYKLETLDGVDDALKSHYTETDGGFVLSANGLPETDTSGLKSALAAERERGKVAKQYERMGLSPDEIQVMIDDKAKIDEADAKKRGDFDAIRKQDKDKYDASIKEMVGEMDAMRGVERSAVIENRLTTSLAKAGFTEEGLSLLPTILSPRIKIETVDGGRVTRIYQADGETPMAGTEKDGTASFADLAKEVSVQYPSLVSGQGTGGGGRLPNTTGSGSSKQMSRADFDTLSSAAQAQTFNDGIKIVD